MNGYSEGISIASVANAPIGIAFVGVLGLFCMHGAAVGDACCLGG